MWVHTHAVCQLSDEIEFFSQELVILKKQRLDQPRVTLPSDKI